MIQLTEKQKRAIERMQKWFQVAKEDARYQVFKIQGYAGTGKTTIVNQAIEALELEEDKVAFATFTGKAASVLTQKGCKCVTIHRLVYNTTMNSDGTFRRHLKTAEELEHLELIVIDEISMVNLELWNILVSFGIPIVTLGDPGQLPPVGKDNGLMSTCHVFLDEIHRQAADNPIIKLSMMARNNEPIGYGTYGDTCIVIPKAKLKGRSLLNADQIICGYNKTRQTMNANMRKMLGHEGDYPVIDDKIICLMNKWNIEVDGYPLINGTIATVTKAKEMQLSFKPDFCENAFTNLDCTFDTTPEKNNPQIPIDFGYAITCHKSQGSEFNRVIVFEEVLKKETHAKWLYTAITRASEKLIIVR